MMTGIGMNARISTVLCRHCQCTAIAVPQSVCCVHAACLGSLAVHILTHYCMGHFMHDTAMRMHISLG